jgi:hypothetical protein
MYGRGVVAATGVCCMLMLAMYAEHVSAAFVMHLFHSPNAPRDVPMHPTLQSGVMPFFVEHRRECVLI